MEVLKPGQLGFQWRWGSVLRGCKERQLLHTGTLDPWEAEAGVQTSLDSTWVSVSQSNSPSNGVKKGFCLCGCYNFEEIKCTDRNVVILFFFREASAT